MLPPTYSDYDTAPVRVEENLKGIVNSFGFNICAAPKLPYKLLTVRSGFSRYGRNNISYMDGMGSFYKFIVFYSDIPCDQQELWEVGQMDICSKCTLCMESCPTKAILKDRYLIDNQRCLTYFNEAGGWDFPEWIDVSVHNSIYGCVKCQMVCHTIGSS